MKRFLVIIALVTFTMICCVHSDEAVKLKAEDLIRAEALNPETPILYTLPEEEKRELASELRRWKADWPVVVICGIRFSQE